MAIGITTIQIVGLLVKTAVNLLTNSPALILRLANALVINKLGVVIMFSRRSLAKSPTKDQNCINCPWCGDDVTFENKKLVIHKFGDRMCVGSNQSEISVSKLIMLKKQIINSEKIDRPHSF